MSKMFSEVKYQDLNTLYSHDNAPRYQQLVDTFVTLYGRKPQFIARAPGRVDIIGGHLDYNHYPVLPIALEVDCLIAVGTTNKDKVEVNHVQKQYPGQELPVDPQQKVVFKNNYLKYFRAGYRAGVKHLKAQTLKGLQVVVGGNVPLAAGLSSSAAFTVCSALTSLHANGGDSGDYVNGSRERFLQDVIVGQMETGVAAGGMDQSISVLGKLDTCLYIQFSPIQCKPIQLPPGLVYIVMNTLQEEVKMESAPFHLNKRFCQCRMVAAVLGKKMGFPGMALNLKEIERWAQLSPETMGLVLNTLLDRHDYTHKEIESLIGISLCQFLKDIPLFQEVLSKNEVFKLWEVSRHILDEAGRLQQFVKVCSSKLSPQTKRQLLGKLIRESMKSTQTLFDSSCKASDEVAELALGRGSLGTKITGAGWGGCTVSLVEKENVDKFMQEMKKAYYDRQEHKQKVDKMGLSNVMFVSRAGQGACLVTQIK